MKKVIKLKWLTITVLSLLLCLSFAMVGLTQRSPKTVNANSEQTIFTSTELGINGKTPISYSTFLSGSSISLDSADIGFAMEKGAAVRAEVAKPGVRYVVNLGAGFDTVKTTLSSATFDFYVLFGAEGRYLFVKGDLRQNDADYNYVASVTFDNVSELNFDAYKAKEISGQGVMVVTNGTEKTVVLADANDNERTMESVVNTAKLLGALDGYSNDVITAMDKYVPGYSVSTEGLYADRATGLDYNEIIGTQTGVKAVYVNTAKVDDAYTKALEGVGEANTKATVNLGEYVTVVDKDGNFTNYNTVTVADQILRNTADLAKLYSNDNSKKLTTTGYFLVANDIAYNPDVTVNPYAGDGVDNTSVFSGKFDGNGKTIEFALTNSGLFGGAANATITNASFIVKAIPATLSNQYTAWGQVSILGRYGTNCTISNIYAKYDCAVNVNLVSHRFVSPGFFAVTNSKYFTYNNVLLDLTNVTIDDIPATTNKFSYGVIWSPLNSTAYYVGTATNAYVIWDNPNLYVANNSDNSSKWYGTSANDKANSYQGPAGLTYFNDAVSDRNDISDGITRHNDYTAAKKYFAENSDELNKFANFVDISYGLPYYGDKANVADYLGDTYYDGDTDDYEGDVAAVLPTIEGKTITKITNSDESVVYYNGSTWSNIPAVATNATAGVDYNALVYGENDELLGATVIRSATKIISTAKDLPSVYSYNATAATTTTGYFLVANDIDAYTENVDITPYYDSSANNGSTFAGVFDGNGKKIEYAITRGGLFDKLTGTVKNASFIVKAVPTAVEGYSIGAGQFAILARTAVNAKIDNIYATYACTLDANIANKAATVSRGIGLFALTSGASDSYTNVVLDLSNATVSNLDESIGFGYGVIRCPEGGASYSGTTSNVYVIWTNKTLYQYANGATKFFGTSSNDKVAGYTVAGYTDYAQSTVKPSDLSNGITRYDTVDAMNTAGKTQVGNWSVTASGVEWVK